MKVYLCFLIHKKNLIKNPYKEIIEKILNYTTN